VCGVLGVFFLVGWVGFFLLLGCWKTLARIDPVVGGGRGQGGKGAVLSFTLGGDLIQAPALCRRKGTQSWHLLARSWPRQKPKRLS